jgi:transcriptional regulator with XRE-family HTH domain
MEIFHNPYGNLVMARTDLNVRIARNLAELMREKRLSEPALARKSGLSKRVIGYFLRPGERTMTGSGKPASGTLYSLERIADALDVDVSVLVQNNTAADMVFTQEVQAAQKHFSDIFEKWKRTRTGEEDG